VIKATCISTAAAAVLLAACAHQSNSTSYSTRGEPVGVNSRPSTTANVDNANATLNPSPSAMATTSATGSNR
jgi:hypothetical protein